MLLAERYSYGYPNFCYAWISLKNVNATVTYQAAITQLFSAQ